MMNRDLSTRARASLPGGVSHELRYRDPHPVFMDRAQGGEKWDVEGRRYIDFKMGSASQMLGHCHPAIVEAIQKQAERSIFSADCHAQEIEWAEWVNQLYPSCRTHPFHRIGDGIHDAGAAAGPCLFGQGSCAAH